MAKTRGLEGGGFQDGMYGSYSPESKGGLLDYLRRCENEMVDNKFSGSKYFGEIVRLGIVRPRMTMIRVAQSPAPDAVYFVNEDGKLESNGSGSYNMSAMGAERGVYDPKKTLKNKIWSIHGLDFRGEAR